MRIYTAGQIHVWPGGSLWIGRSHGTTDVHVHHAVQVSVALDKSFSLRTRDGDAWQAFSAALVPSHTDHAFSATDAVVATTFVEPESHEGRILLERFGTGRPVAIDDPEAARMRDLLDAAWRPEVPSPGLVSAAREAVGVLTHGSRPSRGVDPRIGRAIELVHERIAYTISQEAIAAAVGLSASRFRHLFAKETGLPFRPYVLWIRLQKVLEALGEGGRLTDAAHDAGFADLAHMSRTFRRMFGISPNMLERGSVFRQSP